jgi:prepilin-type N-terminal cleavage/methylation domain-containing protein
MAHTRRHSGFTLIELMVSLALLAVVTVYLTDMLTRQSRTYAVVDSVTEVQQNVRAIANLMERELRVTGLLVPESASVCGLDVTAASDVLFVSDAEAVRFGSSLDYDLGVPITSGYSGTSNNDVLQLQDPSGAGLPSPPDPGGTLLTVDGTATYDLDGDGVNDSDFRLGSGVIVVDQNNPQRGSSCGIITALPDVAGNRLTVDFRLAGAAPGGTALAPRLPGDPSEELVAVPAHVYQVNGTQLQRDGLLLADDVEDLQLGFLYDLNDDDDVTDPGETRGHTAANNYVSNGFDNRALREIQVSFVVRSRAPDPEFGGPNDPQGQFQTAFNRVPVAGNDRFRRRVYTTSVRPRNVGHRPDDV